MKRLRKYLPLIPAVLILVLVAAGIGVWRDYRDTLMKNQEEELLLVTRILRDNLRVSMEEYQDNLEFVSGILAADTQEEENVYRRFLKTHNNFISNLYREDARGNIISSAAETDFSTSVLLAEYTDEKSIWMMSDGTDQYIVFNLNP